MIHSTFKGGTQSIPRYEKWIQQESMNKGFVHLRQETIHDTKLQLLLDHIHLQ